MRIIAGPCQHESYEHSLKIAKECQRVCEKHGIEFYYKASYDKANRSDYFGERGQGLVSTLTDFMKLKNELGIKTLTDVHNEEEVRAISNSFPMAADVIQIPAFLCRQTDLIALAVSSFPIVNIKKGQFLAPWDVKGILSKCFKKTDQVWITERGTSFGYNTLVTDFTGMQYMMENYDVPIVFDVTHSVQKPGGNGNSSGGNRDYVPGLARAASAMGIKNFFLEVHDDPDNAPSDGPNMLRLEDFEKVVDDIVKFSYNEKPKLVAVDEDYQGFRHQEC